MSQPVTGYSITRTDKDSKDIETYIVLGNAVSYPDLGADPGVEYEYCIEAFKTEEALQIIVDEFNDMSPDGTINQNQDFTSNAPAGGTLTFTVEKGTVSTTNVFSHRDERNEEVVFLGPGDVPESHIRLLFGTTPGQSYNVEFDTKAIGFVEGHQIKVQACAGDDANCTTLLDQAVGTNTETGVTFNFTATTDQTTFNFIGVYRGGNLGGNANSDISLCRFQVTHNFNVVASSSLQCAVGMRLPVPGEPLDFDQIIMASDGEVGDAFGRAVAMDGTWAVVGAPGSPQAPADGTAWGKAYIFQLQYKNGKWQWIEQRVLTGDRNFVDVDRRVNFGRAVDISGDLVVVSAPLESAICAAGGGCAQGAVYLFDKETGNRIEKIEAPSELTNNSFGRAVALHKELLAITVPSQLSNIPGKTYFYVPNEDDDSRWKLKSKADNNTSPLHSFNDLFGQSVDIFNFADFSDNNFLNNPDENIWAFIGDVDGNFNDGGNGFWKFHPKILSSGTIKTVKRANRIPNKNDASIKNRGFSLHINKNYLITGGPSVTPGDGKAWLYFVPDIKVGAEVIVDNVTQYKTRFNAPSGVENFGSSVAVNGRGNRTLIGADASVYFFSSFDANWSYEELVTTGLVIDLALDNNWGLAGVPDPAGGGKGAVFAIELEEALVGPDPVRASDGKFNNRVQLTWEDNDETEETYWIFRDGEQIGAESGNATSFSDFDAVPGTIYTYCVSAVIDDVDESARFCDHGWRPLNGGITGRVSSQGGGGVPDVQVCLDPAPNNGLLFDGIRGSRVSIDRPLVPTTELTLELWLRTKDNGFVLLYGGKDNTPPFNQMIIEDLQSLVIKVAGEENKAQTGVSFIDGQWHHLAVTWSNKSASEGGGLKLYKDGVEVFQQAPFGQNDSILQDLFLQLGGTVKGQMDEVRLWNRVRLQTEIQETMNRFLSGKEEGLVGYWPLDENEGGLVADHSSSNSYGLLEGGVYWSRGSDQIEYCALTDQEGNYALNKISYGKETTFKVVPTQAGRFFRPAFRNATLNTDSPVENQVDLTDITSYTVAGRVLYKDTVCPVPGAQLTVQLENREQVASTDNNGRYAIALDLDMHKVEVSLNDHTFTQNQINVNVKDADIAGQDFFDTTTHTFSGFAGGGCSRLIGEVKIEIRSEDNCLVREEVVQGDFRFDLPPLQYAVRVLDVQNVPSSLDKAAVLKFFERAGAFRVDLTQEDQRQDLLYRAPLLVEITGLPAADDGVGCTLGVPVLAQGVTYLRLAIKVSEDFGENGLCGLEEGTVNVFDEISDREGEGQVLSVIDGFASYPPPVGSGDSPLTIGAPNVFEGRTDAEGNDRSFQKSITATVAVPGLEPASATQWVVVTGSRIREGTDFVSAVSEPFPLMILRDPPGDGSYSYIEKGQSITWTGKFEMFQDYGGAGVEFLTAIGPEFTTFFGNFISRIAIKGNLLVGGRTDEEGKTEYTITALERFSTADSDVFVGEDGDVFIGIARNFLFTRTDKLDVVDCEIVKTEALGFIDNGFSTTFAYPQSYIESQLIPSLKEMRDKAASGSLDFPDLPAEFSELISNTGPDPDVLDRLIANWERYLL